MNALSPVFLVMFLVPAAVLCWRIVVSKSRSHLLRIAAAMAAMATIVGAFIVSSELQTFEFKDWRSDVALAAALSGSVFCLIWAGRHRTNRRHRTLSIIAAIVGLVPFVATIAATLLIQE